MYQFRTYLITYQPTDAAYRDFASVEVLAFTLSDAEEVFFSEYAGTFTFIDSIKEFRDEVI